MRKCNAYKGRSGEIPCAANGAHRRQVGDRVYNVCGSHNKQDEARLRLQPGTGDPQIPRPIQEVVQDRLPIIGSATRRPDVRVITNQVTTGQRGGSIARQYLTKEAAPSEEEELLLACSGHRPGRKLNEELVCGGISAVLEKFPNAVPLSGGADGFDRLVARMAHKMDRPFDLVLPHPGYHAHYFGGSQWCQTMTAAARNVYYTVTAGKFHWSMNFIRNIDLIERGHLHLVCSYKPIRDLVNQDRNGGTRHFADQIVSNRDRYGVDTILRISSLTGEPTRWNRPTAEREG